MHIQNQTLSRQAPEKVTSKKFHLFCALIYQSNFDLSFTLFVCPQTLHSSRMFSSETAKVCKTISAFKSLSL